MHAEERQQRIVGRVRADGRIDVTDVAEQLDVAPETIRRDLRTLERHGLVRRVHGGAFPTERAGFETSLSSRTTGWWPRSGGSRRRRSPCSPTRRACSSTRGSPPSSSPRRCPRTSRSP